MKTKILVLIALAAAVTFSFTFSSKTAVTQKTESVSSAIDAPSGGFIVEDKL